MAYDRVQRRFVLLFTSILIPGVGAGASHILPIPGLTTQLRNCESTVAKYLPGPQEADDIALRKMAH